MQFGGSRLMMVLPAASSSGLVHLASAAAIDTSPPAFYLCYCIFSLLPTTQLWKVCEAYAGLMERLPIRSQLDEGGARAAFMADADGVPRGARCFVAVLRPRTTARLVCLVGEACNAVTTVYHLTACCIPRGLKLHQTARRVCLL